MYSTRCAKTLPTVPPSAPFVPGSLQRRRPPGGSLEAMDPFDFVDDDVVEPQGVRELPLAAAPVAASAVSSPVVETAPSVPSPTPADRLAKSEYFFKEVAKADGSEVPQFVSDVMAWASSTNVVDVAEAAPAVDDEPPRRTYAEEKAAARVAAAEAAVAAKAAELKAAAAQEAVAAAKATAMAKVTNIRHEAPEGAIQIEDAEASHRQLARRGTVVTAGANCTPAADRKRKRVDIGSHEAAGSSAVKSRPGKTKRTTALPPAESPASAVKKAPQKQTGASPPATRKVKKTQPRHLVEPSPALVEPQVRARSTRGRNSIAPLPWWTAAGNAVASKRSLKAASLAAAVSAARVM